MRKIILIAHDLRSCHNVGSLFRTAEGLGIEKVFLTGYTPYPKLDNDPRMPHLSAKIDRQIQKTALDAQHYLPWERVENIEEIIKQLKKQGYKVCALEQTSKSIPLPKFKISGEVALIAGNEVEGLKESVLKLADSVIEIPMLGKKESFNVVQAAAMALYDFRFNL